MNLFVKVIVFVGTLFVFIACDFNYPFQTTDSKRKDWKVYETEFVKFELPKRFKIDRILEMKGPVPVIEVGVEPTETRQFPELWVYFSDESHRLLFHYSTVGISGPEPGRVYGDSATFSFKFSESGKYKKRQIIHAQFDEGYDEGGVYVADTTAWLNDVLIFANKLDEVTKDFDRAESKLWRDELDYLSKAVVLKK